jgi:hypothetical protein
VFVTTSIEPKRSKIITTIHFKVNHESREGDKPTILSKEGKEIVIDRERFPGPTPHLVSESKSLG